MSSTKANKKRWAPTKHTGISSDKEGNLLVRAAIKRSGKALTSKRVLPAPVQIGDALLVYSELKAELEGGDRKPTRQLTLAAYSEQWIAQNARISRPGVIKTYVNALAYHVLPEVGHVFLEDLTREQVIEMTEKWVSERMEDGELYAKATVQGWWRVTKAVIADACAEYRIRFSPTARVKLPPMKDRKKRREQNTLSPQQLLNLLRFTEEFWPQRHAELALLALGGFRPSEIFALVWADIDWEKRTVTISKSAGGGHLGGPKTDRSDRDNVDAARTVVVPQRALDALREHRKRQLSSPAASSLPNVIFPSDKGTYRQAACLTKVFQAAQEYLELDIRLGAQVLRRTYNTMLSECTDTTTLQALMGHNDEMNKLYDSVPLDRKLKAISKFEALLAEATA